MRERWRPVPDDVIGYEISDQGRVRRAGRILAPFTDRKGYKLISIHNGIKRNRRHKAVHRLVALAFLPLDASREYVNHKDGNPANNTLSNLEWCTRSENMVHASRVLGRRLGPVGIGNPKISADTVRAIRADVGTGLELSAKYGLCKEQIYRIRRREAWPNLK